MPLAVRSHWAIDSQSHPETQMGSSPPKNSPIFQRLGSTLKTLKLTAKAPENGWMGKEDDRLSFWESLFFRDKLAVSSREGKIQRALHIGGAL